MPHESKAKKRGRRKPPKAQRNAGDASHEGNGAMNAKTFHPENPAPLQGETAAIHEVTAAMMDGAAREAARVADGVAHHTIRHDDHPAIPAQDHVSAGDKAASPVAPSRTEAEDGTAPPPGGAAELFDAATGADEPAATAPVHEVTAGAVQVPVEAVDEGPEARRGADAPGLFRSVASLQRYNAKVLDIVQNNVAATGAFLTALMGAKTLPEAMQVNVDHVTRGVQALTGQSRELTTLAQKLALEALKPFDGARGRDE